MKSIITLFLVYFLAIFQNSLYSQNSVWDTNTEYLDVANQVYYLEDIDNKLNIEQVSAPEYQSKFIKNTKNVVNFGFAFRHYWLKIKVDNPIHKNLLLELNQPYLPSTDFYFVNPKGEKIKYSAGYQTPLYQRVIKHHTQVFPLQKGQHTYYLKIYILAHTIPVKIWKQAAFEQNSTSQKILFGMFVGIMFFVILNNLLLYYTIRAFTYLHYSMLVFIYLWTTASVMDGYAMFIFKNIDLGYWYSHVSPLTMIISTTFAIYFLDLKKYTPKLYKTSLFFLGYFIFYFIIHWFLEYTISHKITNFNALIVLSLIGFLGWKTGHSGNRLGFFVSAAYFIFFVSVIFETMYILTGQPNYFMGISHASIGILIEVLIYAIGLSKKFEWEKDEMITSKTIAQQEALEKTQENEKIVKEQNQMLEDQVARRTLQLNESIQIAETERQKSDALLLNILPAEVAEELRQTGTSTAHNYEMATVLFADIKDFTKISTKFSAEAMVKELDYIFGAFDKIIEKHNIEKIKIIGDAYMCAGGLPISNETNANDMLVAAIEIQEFMKKMRAERAAKNQQQYEIRIGINTGPLVAGIIGIKKFTYDIWGDTVNLASRLESSGEVNKINISENTYQLIKHNFDCEYRGKIEVKGKGSTAMYFVHGYKNKTTNFDLIETIILDKLKNGLSPSLHYHGFPHTLDVIKNVIFIAEKEGITEEDIHLLKMAALFHDLGFLEAYTGHEAVGFRMAREYLPKYEISNDDIEEICKMIMTTKVPQTPTTLLEKILCDADLLYLGTDNFIEIGNTLFKELQENGKIKTELEWNELQLTFLKKHQFHTQFCIENFNIKKAENIELIKNWLNKNKIHLN